MSERPVHGAYHALLYELRECDRESFQNFLRMDVTSFQLLLLKVTPTIERQDTMMRKSIPAPVRLALTLRWLASGMYRPSSIAICRLFLWTKSVPVQNPPHPSTFTLGREDFATKEILPTGVAREVWHLSHTCTQENSNWRQAICRSLL